MNNQQLATVIHSYGTLGHGGRYFFDHFEEQIIESPIPIETEYLIKMLTGYVQMDIGTPQLYSHLAEVFIARMPNIPLTDLTTIAKKFAMTTNGTGGAYGFNKALEKHLYN